MTKRTGALVRHDDPEVVITGTVERLSGEAPLKGVELNADGLVALTFQEEVRIWWEEQQPARDARGLLIFIDENGLELTQDQIALRLEDGTVVFPVMFPVAL